MEVQTISVNQFYLYVNNTKTKIMEFRIKIEKIMADAHLTNDEKNLLIEKLVPYVLSYNALSGLNDNDIQGILTKIKNAGQEGAFHELLERKSSYIDDSPIDMIHDGESICH